MIIVDRSELETKLPEIRGSLTSPLLESVTGADIMASHLEMPASTRALIKRHVDAGAILIQRKSGRDLPASITYRLYSSLARMRECGASRGQCVLLTSGWYAPNPQNNTIICVTPRVDESGVTFHTEHEPRMNYRALRSSLIGWIELGGVVIGVSCDEEIPGCVRNIEKRLKEKKRLGKVKVIWPDGEKMYDPPEPDDPLQTPVEVKDWRTVMAAIRGIGPVLATNLREAMLNDTNVRDTLTQALVWATSDKVLDVPGWGPGKQRVVRDALGLEEGERLAVKLEEFQEFPTSQ